MRETLTSALINYGDPIVGRRIVVEMNAKGDGVKRSEIIRVEVKDFKVVQPNNPSIIVEEIILGVAVRKLSLGGNTKVR